MKTFFLMVAVIIGFIFCTSSIAGQKCEGIEKSIVNFEYEKLKEILTGDPACAKLPIGTGTKEFPLTLSARYDNLPATKELLLYGANPNVETFYEHESPLILAAQRGNASILEALVSGKANINLTTKIGTALFQAADRGQVLAVRFLLAHGADIQLMNWERYCPIHTAARMGHVEVVKIFIEEAGEKVDVLDGHGFQPIHRAAIYNQLSVVNYLVSKGADVDAMTSNNHYSPLHIAARTDSVEVAKFLVEHGSKLNIKDAFGDTPLVIATRYNHSNLTTILLDAGADRLVETEEGNEKLGLFGVITMSGMVPKTVTTCRIILERGFPVNHLNSSGRNALLDYTFSPTVAFSKIAFENPVQFDVYKSCLKLLVQYGSDVEAKDPQGNNAEFYIRQLPKLTDTQRKELLEIIN